jgi:signal transduction histidine kinase
MYQRYTDSGVVRHTAIANIFVLDNGLRVLIGRDLGEPERFRVLVRQALMIALAIMGLGAIIIWFGIGRNALRRIDRMSDAGKKIMAGDLSQRLPVAGSGDEFDRLSVSLNNMLERIEKLNEGLRQVSDNIAHDLKTPLTRLRNKAEAALAHKATNAGYRASLEEIIGESDQLIRTFNALLMISRVEAGSAAAEMSDVDLSQSVADCVELYEPLADEQALKLEADVPPDIHVSGNRELIGQALGNLIDNAIKYSEGSDNPLITVSLAKRDGTIAVSVADHGPGIPADKRGDVVGRFVRLDESRSKPGTGLGLSLVEAVMEMHQGRLELSDTVPDAENNRGLTVSMVFATPSG